MFALLSLVFFKMRYKAMDAPVAFTPGGRAMRRGKERLDTGARLKGQRWCIVVRGGRLGQEVSWGNRQGVCEFV